MDERCYNCGGKAVDKYYLVPRKSGGKPVHLCSACHKMANRHIAELAKKQALVISRHMTSGSGTQITKGDVINLTDKYLCPVCGNKLELVKTVNSSDLGEPLRVITKLVCAECERWGKEVSAKRSWAQGQ